jgi:hypothetical protein
MTAPLSPEQQAVKASAIGRAAQLFVDAAARMAHMSDREIAEAAYVPGGRSVDELERLVAEARARERAHSAGRDAA